MKKLTIAGIILLLNVPFLQGFERYIFVPPYSWSDQPNWEEGVLDANAVIFAFGFPDTSGALCFEPDMSTDQARRLEQNGIRTVLSLGGWGLSAGFPYLADDAKRSKFVNEVWTYCDSVGITGGVNLDWEHPGADDQGTVISLMRDLRQAFSHVSLCLPYGRYNGENYPDEVFPGSASNAAADVVFIMTYPQGGWDKSNAAHLNAPYASKAKDLSIEKSFDYWFNTRGVDPARSCLGQLLGGCVYSGPQTQKIGDPFETAKRYSLKRIGQMWGHLPVEWDPVRKVPFIRVNDTTIVVTENEESFGVKTELTMQYGLQGEFWWRLGMGEIPTRPSVGVEFWPAGQPTDFALFQNYPNPFNPTTTICFSLLESKFVTLAVYNLLGQKVATLLEGKLEDGEHRIIFNAQNLPSGHYFYQLRFNNQILTKKMQLVK